MTRTSKLAGVVIAASAAALFISGCESTSGQRAQTEARIACVGANACKGLSDCKTANSACAGPNECKGQGLVELSAVECAKVTGAGS